MPNALSPPSHQLQSPRSSSFLRGNGGGNSRSSSVSSSSKASCPTSNNNPTEELPNPKNKEPNNTTSSRFGNLEGFHLPSSTVASTAASTVASTVRTLARDHITIDTLRAVANDVTNIGREAVTEANEYFAGDPRYTSLIRRFGRGGDGGEEETVESFNHSRGSHHRGGGSQGTFTSRGYNEEGGSKGLVSSIVELVDNLTTFVSNVTSFVYYSTIFSIAVIVLGVIGSLIYAGFYYIVMPRVVYSKELYFDYSLNTLNNGVGEVVAKVNFLEVHDGWSSLLDGGDNVLDGEEFCNVNGDIVDEDFDDDDYLEEDDEEKEEEVIPSSKEKPPVMKRARKRRWGFLQRFVNFDGLNEDDVVVDDFASSVVHDRESQPTCSTGGSPSGANIDSDDDATIDDDDDDVTISSKGLVSYREENFRNKRSGASKRKQRRKSSNSSSDEASSGTGNQHQSATEQTSANISPINNHNHRRHIRVTPSPITNKNSILKPRREYYVEVILQLPESKANKDIGVFVVTTVLGGTISKVPASVSRKASALFGLSGGAEKEESHNSENSNTIPLAKSIRSAMLPFESNLIYNIRKLFYSFFYVNGIWPESKTIRIKAFNRYVESRGVPLSVANVTLSLSTRKEEQPSQVEKGWILIGRELNIFQRYMKEEFWLCYLIGTVIIMFWECGICLMIKAYYDLKADERRIMMEEERRRFEFEEDERMREEEENMEFVYDSDGNPIMDDWGASEDGSRLSEGEDGAEVREGEFGNGGQKVQRRKKQRDVNVNVNVNVSGGSSSNVAGDVRIVPPLHPNNDDDFIPLNESPHHTTASDGKGGGKRRNVKQQKLEEELVGRVMRGASDASYAIFTDLDGVEEEPQLLG